MKMENRSSHLDHIKAVLILMVVMGHNVEIGLVLPHYTGKAFYMATYLYHMPAFILLQGYFCKTIFRWDTCLSACVEKTVFFLGVYCIAKLLYYGGFFLVDGAFPIWMGDSFWDEGSVPWYMLSSVGFLLLCVFFSKLKPIVGITVAIAAGIFCRLIPQIGTYLSLSRTIVFFPFFLMGFYLKEGTLETYGEKKCPIIVAFGVLSMCALYLVTYVLLAVYPDWYGKIIPILYGNTSFYGAALSVECGIILSMVQYIAAIIFSAMIFIAVPLVSTNNGAWNLISKVGKNTLPIYVFHYPVLLFLWHRIWGSTANVVSLVVIPCILILVLASETFSMPFDWMKTGIRLMLRTVKSRICRGNN